MDLIDCTCFSVLFVFTRDSQQTDWCFTLTLQHSWRAISGPWNSLKHKKKKKNTFSLKKFPPAPNICFSPHLWLFQAFQNSLIFWGFPWPVQGSKKISFVLNLITGLDPDPTTFNAAVGHTSAYISLINRFPLSQKST